MGGKILRNYDEVLGFVRQFRSNEHMLATALTQMIEREKIMVANRYRKASGQEPLPTDPPALPGGKLWEWIIPVPTEWISETGRHQYDKPLNDKATQ